MNPLTHVKSVRWPIHSSKWPIVCWIWPIHHVKWPIVHVTWPIHSPICPIPRAYQDSPSLPAKRYQLIPKRT